MRTATHTWSTEEGVCREQTRQGNTQTVCHVSCFMVWMSLWVKRRACEAKKKKKLSLTACTSSVCSGTHLNTAALLHLHQLSMSWPPR